MTDEDLLHEVLDAFDFWSWNSNFPGIHDFLLMPPKLKEVSTLWSELHYSPERSWILAHINLYGNGADR